MTEKTENGSWVWLSVLWNRMLVPMLLAVVFYLVVTPIGLLIRLTGRDAMGRTDKSAQQSCRVKRKLRDSSHVEKPY